MADYGDLTSLMAGSRRSSPYDRKRRLAEQMLQSGADYSPVDHPLQGAARLAQALVGGWMANKADSEEKDAIATAKKEQQDKDGSLVQALLGAGQPTQTAAPAPMPSGQPVPSTGGTAPPNGRQVYDYLTSTHGLSPTAAAGIAGNLQQESGFDPSYGFTRPGGDNGTAIGAGQWRLDRAENLKKFAQSQGKDASNINTQLDFLVSELKGGDMGAQRAYAMLQQAKTPEEASTAMMHFFRPAGYTPANPQGGLGYQQRVQYAQQFAPGAPGDSLPQGSADGSGNPLPPQTALNQPNSDPGARYEAAARQAMALGRHDIAVKLAQEAVKAREAMATRDANRTVQTVDLGDSVGIMDPRTGQITQRIPKNKQQAPPNLQHVDLGDVIGVLDPKTGQVVQRIPKGKKPGEGEGGAFAGTGMEAQARSALVRAAKEPGFAQSPEYAAVHSYLSRPRQSFDEARGVMVTLPPEDLSAFPRPSFSGGGQPPPQQAPQPNAAPSPVGPQDFGAPPPPAAPPNMPAVMGQPQGPTVTPVPGMPDKPPTGEQALAGGFADRMADAQSTLKQVAKAGLSNQNRMLDRLPLGAGNLVQNPEYQQFRQARDNFINAQLRRESGAAISADEYDKADRQYFPMPGDSPEVLVQKERNRQLAVDAMIRNAGQSYRQNPLVGSGSPSDLKKKYGLE